MIHSNSRTYPISIGRWKKVFQTCKYKVKHLQLERKHKVDIFSYITCALYTDEHKMESK